LTGFPPNQFVSERIGAAAVMARFTRSAMLEILSQSDNRTAIAKGLKW